MVRKADDLHRCHQHHAHRPRGNLGPVLSVITYEDEAEAIAIANDSDFGLQAYVLSSDEDRALRVARQLIAGRVVINGAPHDPRAPFGGFRQSGLGREIGAYGLDAFLEPRAILKPAA
ncbi:aldehyde dehydrogenase family protein [Novosphingobium sp. BL-8H]|uniref:aldehyde dehydrogenase family protein n=1 Tax=Novosphingobium sp. BL-8H TaxID=3127640 RepID=UPI00375690C7